MGPKVSEIFAEFLRWTLYIPMMAILGAELVPAQYYSG